MTLPRIVLLTAILIALPCSAWGQILCQREYEPGKKIVLEYGAAPLEGATAEYAWNLPGCEYEAVDGGRKLLVWAPSGDHRPTVDAKFTIDIAVPDPADKSKIITRKLTLPAYHWEAEFSVSGVTPSPVKTLRDLAGADAPAIGSRLAALSSAVKSGNLPTNLFATVFKASVMAPWVANPAIPVIEKRLAKPTTVDAIVAELDKIVAELGTTPGPGPGPVPTPGKRRVVILHESLDDTPAFGAMAVALRSGVPQKFLADRGHVLDIVDDDVVDPRDVDLVQMGVPLPSLFILEPVTDTVIYKQTLPEGTKPSDVTELVDQYDG